MKKVLAVRHLGRQPWSDYVCFYVTVFFPACSYSCLCLITSSTFSSCLFFLIIIFLVSKTWSVFPPFPVLITGSVRTEFASESIAMDIYKVLHVLSNQERFHL